VNFRPLDLCLLSTRYLPFVLSVCNIPEPLTANAVSRWYDRYDQYDHTNATFCTVYTVRDTASLNKAISSARHCGGQVMTVPR
jgi:hypothetical protein